MKLISHKAIGISSALLFNFDIKGVVAAAAGAILPDVIDMTISGKNKWLWRKLHRTISHWWALWVAVICASLMIDMGSDYVNSTVFCLAIGALTHLACDLLTPMGLPLFNPFKQKAVSLNIFPTGSLREYLFAALFAAGVVLYKLL